MDAIKCEVCGILFDGCDGDRACNFYCFIALKEEGRRSRSHRRWQAEKAKETERRRLRARDRDGEEPDPRSVGIRAKSHGCPCPGCRAVAAEFKYNRVKDQGWKREVMTA